MHTWLNPPNRRMRTRTHGGEGGEARLSPYPDSSPGCPYFALSDPIRIP